MLLKACYEDEIGFPELMVEVCWFKSLVQWLPIIFGSWHPRQTYENHAAPLYSISSINALINHFISLKSLGTLC